MDFKTIKDEIIKHPEGGKMLSAAFTHRSYASENNLSYDNQRLEFLGDAVIELILSAHLFHLYPDSKEGAMTAMRSALVREETLANLARKLKLGQMLKIGRGERELQGNKRDSTLADLFEALFGACYLVCGYETTEKIVLELFKEYYPDPGNAFKQLNPKGTLQEFTQGKWNTTPTYKVLKISGPPHRPDYEVEVTVNNFVAPGNGNSKRDAESDAAGKLYNFFTEKKKSSVKK